MPSFENFVPVFLLATFAYWGIRYFRYGSLTGALVGARIRSTVGELTYEERSGLARTIRVHAIEPKADGTTLVAVQFVTKGTFSYGITHFVVPRSETAALAELLRKASAS